MTPTNWLENMREIWLSKQPNKIAGLLSENFDYFEDPTQDPLIKKEDVVEAWQEIITQDIEYVEIEILHEDKNVGVALWRFKQVNEPEHVGCYFLKLDDDGKCIQFRQWWNVV